MTKRILLATLLTAGALALAAPAPADAQGSDPPATKKRKLRKFDFSGDNIEGTTVNPDGADVNVRQFATFENLIKVRQSFADKILRDTEDVE